MAEAAAATAPARAAKAERGQHSNTARQEHIFNTNKSCKRIPKDGPMMAQIWRGDTQWNLGLRATTPEEICVCNPSGSYTPALQELTVETAMCFRPIVEHNTLTHRGLIACQ